MLALLPSTGLTGPRGAKAEVGSLKTYSYNKVTGAPTLVGPTLLANLFKAAAFNASGVLYGMEGGGGTDTRTCVSS